MKNEAKIYLAHLTVSAGLRDIVIDKLEALGSSFVEWDEKDADHVVFDEYFDSHDEALLRVAELKNLLPLDTSCSIEFRTLEKENWAESWKKHFKAERISDRIVVRPSWESFDAKPDDCVIVLDPGMSFGTGQHPTTRSCLRFIDRLSGKFPAASFLDIGCGSGILSVAAAELGLVDVTAIDLDDDAVTIAKENIKTNGVASLVDCQCADMSTYCAGKTYDIVVANMLAHLIGAMVPQIADAVALHENARLILSGCLDKQIDDILVVFRLSGFREESRINDNGWTSVCLSRDHALKLK
ncbi:MAG: 50S ribosomal protein L11 methyltransferase [Kiritimatiellae bacterium]|nr:50S ribosomal protein L11 methyltransferase [Kiritimatiellia bacterium]